MPETCSKFVGGGIQSGDNLDRLEWTAQVFLHIAKAQSEATICRRFNQKSGSLGNPGATGVPYAMLAKPHKHWRLRISLIWRVGT